MGVRSREGKERALSTIWSSSGGFSWEKWLTPDNDGQVRGRSVSAE